MVKLVKKLQDMMSKRVNSAEQLSAGLVGSGLMATPYRVLLGASIAQGTRCETKEPPRRGMGQRWTRRKVAAFETSALHSELARLGVPIEKPAFVAAARENERHSAWDVSRPYRKNAKTTGHDDDFIGLAFCELWKRWLTTPSVEQVDDSIDDGVYHEMHGGEALAIDAYIAAWRTLQSLPKSLALIDGEDWFGVEDWGWVVVTTLDRLGRTSEADAFVAEIGAHMGIQLADAMQESRELARNVELDLANTKTATARSLHEHGHGQSTTTSSKARSVSLQH